MLNPYGRPAQGDWLLLLSPAMIIPFAEYSFMDLHWITDYPWIAVILNSLAYASILLFVQLWCVWKAPRLLGRAERPGATTAFPDRAGRPMGAALQK